MIAICFKNGKMQLMTHQNDTRNVKLTIEAFALLDTGLQGVSIKWNHLGTVLAVCGVQNVRNGSGDLVDTCTLQLWNRMGQMVTSLKIPGSKVTAISWDKSGSKIVISMDGFVYFASVRNDFLWARFAKNTLVYSQMESLPNPKLFFWNTKTNDKRTLSLKQPYLISGYGNFCLIVSKDFDNAKVTTRISICNSLGSIFSSIKHVEHPEFAQLTSCCAILATKYVVIRWNIDSAMENSLSGSRTTSKYHIDHFNKLGSCPSQVDRMEMKETGDAISALIANDQYILLARSSGKILQLATNSMNLLKVYDTVANICRLFINCDSSCFATIDKNYLLQFMYLERGIMEEDLKVESQQEKPLRPLAGFEKKDAWEFLWSEDTPERFIVLQKSKIGVFKNEEEEEQIYCTGCILA